MASSPLELLTIDMEERERRKEKIEKNGGKNKIDQKGKSFFLIIYKVFPEFSVSGKRWRDERREIRGPTKNH